MWNFIARQLLNAALRQAGDKIGGQFFNSEVNGPEVYADRIKRDFRLHDYADAWALYDSDRAYWERWYSRQPAALDPREEFVRDSAAAAGNSESRECLRVRFPRVNVRAALDQRGSGARVRWASRGRMRLPITTRMFAAWCE